MLTDWINTEQKCPSSSIACTLTRYITHWACLGCSGSTCTNNVFQFPPISSNFAQPLKRGGTTFHSQQPDELYVKEMCCTAWGKFWSHKTLTGFLIHTPTFFLRYLWPTDAHLYSKLCETHILGPNLFISIDWFPYMNYNSVKSLKLLHVVFLCLFSTFDPSKEKTAPPRDNIP